jgi:hypothetical protein
MPPSAQVYVLSPNLQELSLINAYVYELFDYKYYSGIVCVEMAI